MGVSYLATDAVLVRYARFRVAAAGPVVPAHSSQLADLDRGERRPTRLWLPADP